MNESVREWFRYHTDFLYTMIYENGLFYLDFWSLVHAWSSIVLFTLIAASVIKRKWFWFIFVIIFYEIAEVLFIYFAFHIFRPERYNDLIMDIVVGITVAIIWNYTLIWKPGKERVTTLPGWLFRIFSAFTFSFVWVGNYHYHYNLELLNSRGLNIWAFSLWMIGGYILLIFYDLIKNYLSKVIWRIFTTWIAYFITLLIIEFVGYHLLGIREDSLNQKKALIFGLIHGTFSMHIYYLLFPFFIISFYDILVKQTVKAQLNLIARNEEPTQICAYDEI